MQTKKRAFTDLVDTLILDFPASKIGQINFWGFFYGTFLCQLALTSMSRETANLSLVLSPIYLFMTNK